MTDTLAQQGRDQEEALIGAVLRRPALYDELAEMVTPKDFGWQAFGQLWQSFANLREQGMVIDSLTAGDELHRMGKLDAFAPPVDADVLDPAWTGRAAISKLREQGDPDSARSYASNVLDYANKHKLLLKFQESVYHAANGRKAADIVADVTTFMGTLSLGGAEGVMESTEAVRNAVQESEDASKGNLNVVPTGYVDLDRILAGGAREGRLYIVAGRPGDGKSAWLLNVARNGAKTKKVGFISMEMSTTEQVNRLLAQLSGIDSQRIEMGKFTDEEWPIYYQAVESAAAMSIYWDDEPSLSLPQLRSKARRMADKGLDLLVVDSLNMMDSKMPNAKVFEQINALAYGLKKLARELQIPIWVAHHTSKEGEKLQREPILADLEQAGEKPADLVAFVYKLKDDALANVRRLKIAKHRGGPTGYVDLIFRDELTRFENAVTRRVDLNKEPVYPH